MSGTQVDLDAGGRIVKSATTGADGRYSVAIAAGTYAVRVVWVQSAAVTGNSHTVTVAPGQRVEADLQISFQAG
jgi:hypothetical protein